LTEAAAVDVGGVGAAAVVVGSVLAADAAVGGEDTTTAAAAAAAAAADGPAPSEFVSCWMEEPPDEAFASNP
jgi:hypothetical protein